MAQPSPPRRVLAPGAVLAPLVVALITIAAFLPTLRNGFLDWDDEETLVTNLHYRGLGWSNLGWMFTTTHMGHWVPLSWVTFGADYLVWGMNPHGYHLTNLLLHTGGAVAFYFVALRLLGLAQPRPSDTALRAAAVVAALFFSIHPLRVESVAWATERRDVLSGLWFLLTIVTYLRAVAGGGSRRRWWLAGSVGCYALAVLSKGIVVTLPLVLIILDVYPLRRLWGGWRQWTAPGVREIWVEKIPYALLALTAAGMAIYAGHSVAASLQARPLAGRIGVALYGLVFYLRKTAVPVGIWPLYQIPWRVDPLAPPIVASAVAVVALTAGLFLLRHKWPAGLAAWLLYGIILSPVSGLMQSGPQLVAARYSYLPCLGWALLLGALVCLFVRAIPSGRLGAAWTLAGTAAMAVLLLGFGAATREQVRIWHDPRTFWSYAVAVAPASSIAQGSLGTTLVREGRLDEARKHLETAAMLNPDHVETLTNLASVLAGLGRKDDAAEVLRLLDYARNRKAATSLPEASPPPAPRSSPGG